MKKLISLLFIIALVFTKSSCSTESTDDIFLSDYNMKTELSKHAKQKGYDQWGFNFTAHNFKGYLINAMLGDPAFEGMPHYRQPGLIYHGEGQGFWDELVLEYPYFTQMMPAGLLDCRLEMKWNDAMLNSEGVYPPTWNDADAWIMFKYKMHTPNENWSQLRKLVSISTGDELIDGVWYDSDGREIGIESYYWSDRLIIKQVVNTGENMYVPAAMPDDYVCPNSVGFGNF
ncbi:hypothetical protein [Christiangramia crocea]|uniref:Uncharacterized protein n=1 Tax=Christiangramia crocea TaxID=2904124 RepID=A0A9X1V0S8_9FLAO|nr:hypothetical protein [Gramella crocea]MCG9972793.1 hypothetical protein [Gramella crocea]